jgi:hypothetical protein
VSGNVLRYARTFNVKEASVPLAKMEDLKKLYRIIANDERNTAAQRSRQRQKLNTKASLRLAGPYGPDRFGVAKQEGQKAHGED